MMRSAPYGSLLCLSAILVACPGPDDPSGPVPSESEQDLGPTSLDVSSVDSLGEAPDAEAVVDASDVSETGDTAGELPLEPRDVVVDLPSAADVSGDVPATRHRAAAPTPGATLADVPSPPPVPPAPTPAGPRI